MIYATVVGNVGNDAQVKTVGDATVTEFSVASNFRKGGEKQVEWVKCSLWGQRGEKLAEHILKGKTVIVMGELSVRTFTKSDGSTGHSVEVRADHFEFGGSARTEDPEASHGKGQAPPERPEGQRLRGGPQKPALGQRTGHAPQRSRAPQRAQAPARQPDPFPEDGRDGEADSIPF